MKRNPAPRQWKEDAPDDPAARLLAELSTEATDSPETEQVWRRNVWRRLDTGGKQGERAWSMLRWLAVPVVVAVVVFDIVATRRQVVTPIVLAPRLESATGTVLAMGPAGTWRKPAREEPLPADSKLRTGDRGQALFNLPGVADVLLQAGTTVAVDSTGQGTTLRLESGGVLAHVTPRPADQPFAVELHGVRVRVVGTVFSVVERPSGAVEVSVAKGVVEVMQGPSGPAVHVAAGQSWNSAAPADLGPDTIVPQDRSVVEKTTTLDAATALAARDPIAVPPLIPHLPLPRSREARLEDGHDPQAVPGTTSSARSVATPGPYERAHRLQTQGDTRGAATALEQVIASSDAHADIALYDLGRLRLRELADTRGALDAFYKYRAEYPHGALEQEVDISIIEAVLARSDLPAAKQELTRFLAAYPDSERRSEVFLLRGNVLRETGQCASALADYRQVTEGQFSDDALYSSAWCQQQLGQAAAFQSTLAQYLRRFPSGAHRREVESALQAP